MEFVPYIGPFVAAIPAILVGFAEGPQLGLWVAALLAVQSMLYVEDALGDKSAKPGS